MQVSSCWMNASVQAELKRNKRCLASQTGRLVVVQRKIEVGDAFGICTIRFASVQPCTLKVLQNLYHRLFQPFYKGLQGGGDHAHPYGLPTGDRIDIRIMLHGDPVRYIFGKCMRGRVNWWYEHPRKPSSQYSVYWLI